MTRVAELEALFLSNNEKWTVPISSWYCFPENDALTTRYFQRVTVHHDNPRCNNPAHFEIHLKRPQVWTFYAVAPNERHPTQKLLSNGVSSKKMQGYTHNILLFNICTIKLLRFKIMVLTNSQIKTLNQVEQKVNSPETWKKIIH